MVAPQQMHLFGTVEFQEEEKRDDLNAELPAIHVVPKEEVLLLCRTSIFFENVQ